MDQKNESKIKKFTIDDSIVQFALTAPMKYLEPRMEHVAVAEMAVYFGSTRRDLCDAEIWSLTEEQRTKFAYDYAIPTPLRYASVKDHKLTRLSLLQVIFSLSLGTPFGLPDQRDGVIVQDIFPRVDKTERVNASFGSKEDFAFHTDQAYNADVSEVPTSMTLLCIRNQERGMTRVIHLSTILKNLTQTHTEVLKEPYFRFYTGRPEENIAVRVGPVLTDAGDLYTIRVATDMTAINPVAQAALLSLRRVMKMKADNIILEHGDISVLPNSTTVHSRSPFNPNPLETQRRWLQRIFIK